MKKTKKVLFQGSFDLFHFGHLRALQRAKEKGDYLFVAVNTDKLYNKYKQKEPVIPYKYRKGTIEAIKCVDKVVPANYFSPLNLLKKYDIDVYVICQEWKETKKEEMEYMKFKGGKTVILPYLKTISSTEIRSKLIKNYAQHSNKYCAECHKKL